MHFIESRFLPAIDSLSSIHKPDSIAKFRMSVADPVSKFTAELEVGELNYYYKNDIKYILQSALDEDRTSIELILRPNHVGYDPGFIAVSADPDKSSTYLSFSRAVKP